MFLLPALVSLIGDLAVRTSMMRLRRKSEKNTDTGMTGGEVAHAILNQQGLKEMSVIENKKIGDAYLPTINTISLKPNVYRKKSIVNAAIAAHEAGHAMQDDFLDRALIIVKPLRLVEFGMFILTFVTAILSIWFESMPHITRIVFTITMCISTTSTFLSLFVEADASIKGYQNLKKIGILKTKKDRKIVLKSLILFYLTYFLWFITAITFALNFLFFNLN